MNKAELRAKILATSNPKPVAVEVPEWGDGIFVRPLLVGEVEALGADVDPKLRAARGVARMLCDENGELLFDPESTEDLFAINGLRASSLSRINAAMEKVNASTAEEAQGLGNG